ncbi:DUF1351 domain-containing protein [Sporomusa sphaeroides]|uniref:DUF1351 domain-containing protein n=1 Tax=Sporomusa sphaeroides TaxID=47679 RepID=UPI003DA093EC
MPNDDIGKTIQEMMDRAAAAGLEIPEIPDSITESTEIVPETVDVVLENPETVPAMIEPRTLTLSQQFAWNFEELKTALSTRIQKYTGLIVTDDNLKEMERTHKEIAGLRTKIGKFKLEVKRELEKPYQEFELQIRELLDLVASVEKPIMDQIEKYETDRKDREREKLRLLIAETAAECGLEEKYSSQIIVDEKWLNRTAKKKEVTEAIQTRVAWYLDIQSQERQAVLFKAQRAEMANLLCQTLSVGLTTPLTYEEIQPRIESMEDILAVKAFIEGEVAQRKEREQRAAQAAIEAAVATEPSPEAEVYHEYPGAEAEPPEYDDQLPVTGGQYIPDLPPMPPIPPPMPNMPPIPSQHQPRLDPPMPPAELWDVNLHISAITVAEAEELKTYMTSKGLAYQFSGYTRRV